MKLFYIFCLAMVAASAALPAQLTLTASNYSRLQPGETLPWYYLNDDALVAPERGPNRTWDYTNAPILGYYPQITESPDNQAFPAADIRIPVIYSFAGYNLDLKQYFDFNDQGYYSLGDSYAGAILPGDSGSDTLFLPAQDEALPRTELLFPATYGSAWSSAPVRYVIDAEAKIGIFPKTPAQLVQNFAATTDTIIGWGTLRLPGGLASEVLLKKQTVVRVDSFYIGGFEAPEFVLNQLGLKQGEVTREERYVFYGAGIKGEAMSISFVTRGDLSFKTAYFNGSIPTSVGETTAGADSFVAPNPVVGGEAMLSFRKTNSQPWSFVLSDILGREVFRSTIEAPQGDIRFPLHFGNTPANGLYMYGIYSDTGIRTAGGTIVVQ